MTARALKDIDYRGLIRGFVWRNRSNGADLP